MSLADVDLALLRAARTAGHTASSERAVAAFSRLGEHGACWLALGAAGALADPPRRERWLRAVRTVALAYLVNQGIKVAVRRRRPELPGLPPVISTQTKLSFPSAHATTAFAGARAYAALGVPAAPLALAASALALSRVWLGVHHPSDVLAGALLGTAVGRPAR